MSDDDPWGPGYPRPQLRAPGRGWAVPGGDFNRAYPTQIYHASLDCPAIRERIEQVEQMEEFDTKTGEIWTWTGKPGGEGWIVHGDGEPAWRENPNRWRPCLRCGSVADPEPEVCPKCFLTTCDCDE